MRCCLGCHLLFPAGDGACFKCGGALDGGAMLIDGRYLIDRPLGAGAEAQVLLAHDVPLRREVAIKMMPASSAQDPLLVASFHREASALSSVQSDHVAKVYALGVHQKTYFFAMEFVRGASLRTIIKQHTDLSLPMPVYRASSVLKQVAAGLSAVHAAGLVHRDVKPANIVVESETGRAVLVDFGIVSRGKVDEPSRAVLLGTPAYMAPELVLQGESVPQTDVYALGCTAFELLTGRPPFVRDDLSDLLAAHLHDDPPLASSLRPELAPLDTVITRSLAKAPHDRFATADAFSTALDLAVAEVVGAASSRSPQPRASGPRVLVVDDDPVFVLFASRALGTLLPEGSVKVARSGAEALSACERAPSLVLLDYNMPGMNGIEVLSRLRERPAGDEMRVIVVSASAGPDAIARFALLGVTEFLKKPVPFPQLVARVGEIAKSKGWAR